MKQSLRKLIPNPLINYGKHLPEAIAVNVKYKFPSKGLTVIGVTGTDGKTTTTNLIYQILKSSGKKVSMVSTINAVIGDKVLQTGFHVTSPAAKDIQRYILEAKKAGSNYLVLEVTSHALDQFRFWGIKFDIGVITNITHEHLDYHKTFASYRQTKSKLIKKVRCAILNKDDPNFDFLKAATTAKVVNVSLHQAADLNLKKFPLKLKLPGDYNLMNALQAAAVAQVLGVDDKLIKSALEKFTSLPGRMEEVKNNKGIKIIIDFAHTPNGLTQAISTLKTSKGKLIALIGAEGYRDVGKRSLMGKVATEMADFVIITAVDPRGQLSQITDQIMQGVETAGGKLNQNIFVIDDRQKAIDYAINSLAKKGDTVAIFGKGHETSMNLDGKKELPWSDSKAVLKVLNKDAR